ncbi:MAG: DUF262 domain-containing protein [Actinomycetales bacterium]|nr:DUF262 domain-containing protein [Actinomycetales bacterium]
MASIFKTVGWDVNSLVGSVGNGNIQLPDLQRPFVWPRSKVRDLLDSMYRGYPVGELMFWDVSADGESHSISKGAKLGASHQIVDGQQRLTSLYAVVKGMKVRDEDYHDKEIKIAFNPFTEKFEVSTPAFEKSAQWIADISTFFAAPFKASNAFQKRFEATGEELTEEQEEQLHDVFNRLAGILDYVFEVVHIQDFVEKRTVADIFVRINSEGVNLKAYDYILTWLSVFWPDGREQLEEFARNSRISAERATEVSGKKVNWTAKNHFIDVETGQLIRVMVAIGQHRAKLADAYNALQAKDRKTGAVDADRQERELALLQGSIQKVLNPLHWDEYTMCLPQAGFRSRKGITSTTNIVSTYVIWLIGRTEFNVALHDLRLLMARWFFMSQITSRYSGSSETQLQKDIDRFFKYAERKPEDFIREINEVIANELTADFWEYRMPESLVTSMAALSPGYQAYLAALNILNAELFMINLQVRVWMDPTLKPRKGVEGHHIFPRAYQRDVLGTDDIKRINQAANFAPTDWDTNLIISDRSPKEYWPDLVAKRSEGPEWLSQQMYWHALPENWHLLDYDDFLQRRRKLIAKVTRDGFEKLSSGTAVPIVDNEKAAEQDGTITFTLNALIERGIVKVGDTFVPTEESLRTEAEVTEDGTIIVDGNREFDTLDDATRALGITNMASLDFWSLTTDDGPRPLSELLGEG